jgi:hypothetical protein
MFVYLLTAAVAGSLLLYAPGFEGLADYSKELMLATQSVELTLVADSLSDPRIATAKNLYLYGTPSSRYYAHYWRDKLPVRFAGDTVRLGDSTLIGDDYVFSCHLQQDSGRTADLAVASSADGASGMTDLFGHDFVLSRARDGVMYERDLTCYGRLVQVGDKYVAADVVWLPRDRTALPTFRAGNIVLHYERRLLTDSEATRVVRLAQVEYQGYERILQVDMPDTIHIYLRTTNAPPQAITCYSIAQGTIWFGVASRDALLHPTSNPVLTLAHELGRIALQPLSHEYRQSLGADDWSHYAPMVVILPEVERVLGDTAWIAPYDYRPGGLEKFLALYKGGERTYAWILYEVGRKYGTRPIGEAVRRVIKDRNWRHPDMVEFMNTLGSITGDTAIEASIRSAFPTPFENSFYRTMRWRETGMSPTLDRMFSENRFVVDSVPVGSLADSLGFRAGDSIIAIDGISTDTLKDVCKRNLLHKERGAEVIYSIRRSGTTVQLRSRAE